jgi:hypothetical protein
MDDDDDNFIGSGNEANELVTKMVVPQMLSEVEVKIEPGLGVLSGATNVVDRSCHPSASIVTVHSTPRDTLS